METGTANLWLREIGVTVHGNLHRNKSPITRRLPRNKRLALALAWAIGGKGRVVRIDRCLIRMKYLPQLVNPQSLFIIRGTRVAIELPTWKASAFCFCFCFGAS